MITAQTLLLSSTNTHLPLGFTMPLSETCTGLEWTWLEHYLNKEQTSLASPKQNPYLQLLSPVIPRCHVLSLPAVTRDAQRLQSTTNLTGTVCLTKPRTTLSPESSNLHWMLAATWTLTLNTLIKLSLSLSLLASSTGGLMLLDPQTFPHPTTGRLRPFLR